MLDDDGVSADVARWQTWTHCLVKQKAFRCHLGELLDQRTLELSLIANHLRNAHAYPHLLPHFAAAGLLEKSWSPPPEHLLSLRCGTGPSDPVPTGKCTRIFGEFQGNCFHCGEWGHRKIHCPHYIPPRPHKSTKCPLISRITASPLSQPHPPPPTLASRLSPPSSSAPSSSRHRIPSIFATPFNCFPPVYQPVTPGYTQTRPPFHLSHCILTHHRRTPCDYHCHFCPSCRVDLRTTPHHAYCSYSKEDDYEYDDACYVGNDADAYD